MPWVLRYQKLWPYQPTYFSSLHDRLFAAFLKNGRCRQKDLGELSKALRRPHVLATTLLVRGPFGKERKDEKFVRRREVRLLRSRKPKSFSIPRRMTCGEFVEIIHWRMVRGSSSKDYEVRTLGGDEALHHRLAGFLCFL
jgi:hypothetical protein